MVIAYLTLADNLSGGNLRVLQIAKQLRNKNDVTFTIPADKLNKLRGEIENNFPELLSVVENFHPLPVNSYALSGALDHYRFASKLVESALQTLRPDMIYFAHENLFVMSALRLGGAKWSALFQLVPAVYNLVTDYRGPSSLRENYRLIMDADLSAIGGWKIYAKVLLLRWALGDKKVLSVSRSIAEDLRRLGVRADVRIPRPQNAAEDCRPGPARGRDIDVLFSTRAVREKGVFDFLEIARLLKARAPWIRITISGATRPEERSIIYKLATEAGVETRLDVPRDELMELRSKAKLILYPSRFDAFPLAVMEALKCGTPVLAYDIPAIKYNYPEEAVRTVPFRDVFSMADEALRLLGSEDYLRRMGQTGLMYSEGFTWEAVANAEYRELMRILEDE
ncbi:MAG: glycosyltransferase family 4 protein [Conexivisphaera sp.]